MQPEVCMVCLCADRPQFLKRLLASFRAQSYKNCRLLVYDNGETPADTSLIDMAGKEIYVREKSPSLRSVGALRNAANSLVNADIIAHADVDDFSHPNRIAEQVALLQASGADCVGYSDMLFWDTTRPEYLPLAGGGMSPYGWYQAWLYLGPQKALGTSLCYWRRTWEAKPFPDQPQSSNEEVAFMKGLNVVAVSSLGSLDSMRVGTIEGEPRDGWRTFTPGPKTMSGEPRMIASIHGRNTSGVYKLMDNSDSWKRVPEWDSHCRKAMEL